MFGFYKSTSLPVILEVQCMRNIPCHCVPKGMQKWVIFSSLEKGKSTQNPSQNPISGNYLGFDFRPSVKPSPQFQIVGFFLCKQQLLVLLSQSRIFLPYQMIEPAGLCKETPHKQKSLV